MIFYGFCDGWPKDCGFGMDSLSLFTSVNSDSSMGQVWLHLSKKQLITYDRLFLSSDSISVEDAIHDVDSTTMERVMY